MENHHHHQQQQSHNPETRKLEPSMDPPSTCLESTQESDGLDSSEWKPSFDQNDIVKALEVVERDSIAIAESFSSLFASLRLALSEATNSSVEHMQCFSDAAGRLQESVLDAATKGNRYINSCLRSFLFIVCAIAGSRRFGRLEVLYQVKLLALILTQTENHLYALIILNEEMKGAENLASQLYPFQLSSVVCLLHRKFLRRNVDALDSAVNKLVRPP
ncbi:hypothetical protein JRO89_XS13G0162500 [Xanthoceras sorbifolium]|uniref:BLOC-1-related complex subunit 6 C-terminal helix domain-containing protein n=1 Tax=Xanthoceras sorbifolium TaxID=99658 RepID=A0ABQ8H8M2_9ROSI|nr:hypothetical protein JRO89_XS13G0162500 [Xanthoceras sorbifolium]